MDDTDKNFKAGDLVWIELNKYPHWPVKIADPNRARKKPKMSKSQFYVYAFGIHRLLWVSKDNVKAHSAAILEDAKSRKMKATYKRAIDEIEKWYGEISKVSNAAQNADMLDEPEIKAETIESTTDSKFERKETTTRGNIKKENSPAIELPIRVVNIYEKTNNEGEIRRVIGEIYLRDCLDILEEPDIKAETIESTTDPKFERKETTTRGNIKKENSSAIELPIRVVNIYENINNEGGIPVVIGELYLRDCLDILEEPDIKAETIESTTDPKFERKETTTRGNIKEENSPAIELPIRVVNIYENINNEGGIPGVIGELYLRDCLDIIEEPDIKVETIESTTDPKCERKETVTKGNIKKENSHSSATEFLRGIAKIYGNNKGNGDEIPKEIGEIYLRECKRENNYQYDEEDNTYIINQTEESPQSPPIPNITECSKGHIIPSKLKIGFIGLGLIGHGAVKCLLHAGHNVTIWTQDNVLQREYIEAGAHSAETPFHLAHACDLVFNCINDEEAVKSMVFGNSSIMDGFVSSGNPASKGYIEMSCIEPSLSEDIKILALERGIKYLEAPVIGSRTLADRGALLVIAAGDVELFRACESAFRSMAQTTYFLSENVGSASSMCTIVNMLHGTTCAALAEAVGMSNCLDLNTSAFSVLLNAGPLNCPLIKNKANAMINRHFTPDVALSHQQETINSAINLGNRVGQPLLVAASANEVFKRAILNGYSDHDVSAVIM